MAFTFTLSPVPAQVFDTTVDNQRFKLGIYQLSTGLFMDVYVNDVLIIGGVLCLNRNVIIRSAYFGVSGDFAFVDLEGDRDPDYLGLGTRYKLFWFPDDYLEFMGIK